MQRIDLVNVGGAAMSTGATTREPEAVPCSRKSREGTKATPPLRPLLVPDQRDHCVENPKGDITNSDLEQAGVICHLDVVANSTDIGYCTVGVGCDNTPSVSCFVKGATTALDTHVGTTDHDNLTCHVDLKLAMARSLSLGWLVGWLTPWISIISSDPHARQADVHPS